MAKVISVPFTHNRTAEVTIFDQVDHVVMDGDKELGKDLKTRAQLYLMGKLYRSFTILENTFDREMSNGKSFKAGTVSVMEPSILRSGKFMSKYRTRDMDDLCIAVRIAYLAVYGISASNQLYAKQDRFGQTCLQCDRMWRPGQGHAAYECLAGMRPDIDTDELQMSDDTIIDFNGRFLQAYSCEVRAGLPEAPWFSSVESLDHALEEICHGVKKDLKSCLDFMHEYPVFLDEDVIDPDDGIKVDPERVRSLLKKRAHRSIFAKLLFEEMLTIEDYVAYPHTISHFMEICVPEDKGYHMRYIGRSDDALEVYRVNSSCPYGRNDRHRAGYLTEQINVAAELATELQIGNRPTIMTCSSASAKRHQGFLVVHADRAAIAPSPETEALPNPAFIEAYVVELRSKFAALKDDLAKIVSHDRILVVSDDIDKERSGLGFYVVPGAHPEITDNASVDSRHVFAWVLSKISERHSVSTINR